jgi:SecD/SecF fusion protein
MKLWITSIAIILTLAFLGGRAAAAEPAAAPPKLGADQCPRWILVYKVDEQKCVWRPEKMDALVVAISRRINAHWWNGISVKGLGANMVQIDMPVVRGGTPKEKQAEEDQIKRLIATTGALEFRILATKRDDETLIERAKAERAKFPPISSRPLVVSEGNKRAKWIRVRDQEVDSIKNGDAAMMVGKIKVKDKDGKDVEKDVWEVLVLDPENEDYNVTGAYIRDARAGTATETGMPEVIFSFNREGAAKFGRLTGEHVPSGNFKYRLAIVMDDELQTAPTLQSQITTGKGRISGHFDAKQVKEIVDIINAGSLPAALEPTPVRDTIIAGAVSK